MTGDISLQEVVNKKEGLKEEYKKAVKKDMIEKSKQAKQKVQKKEEDTAWGQLDTMVEYSRSTISNAQGYEEPGVAEV